MHQPWLSHQPPSQSLTCLHFQWLPIAPRATPAAKLHPCSCDQDPGHLSAPLPYPMSLPSSLSPCPRYSAKPWPQRFSYICQPLSPRDAPVPTSPALELQASTAMLSFSHRFRSSRLQAPYLLSHLPSTCIWVLHLALF